MKILMLNYEYPPLGGGAGIATRAMLKEFAAYKDLSIDLVTSSHGSGRKESVSENITVHYLDIGKKGRNLLYQSEKDLLAYLCKALFYCKELMKTVEYDLVHAFFSVPCGFAAMLLGKPYIVSLRGSDVPFHNPRFGFLDRFLFSWLSGIVWDKARFVVANSETLVTAARKIRPVMEFGLIYNGVDADIFTRAAGKKNEEGYFEMLYAGRLSGVKGVDTLIDAFGMVLGKSKGRKIRLLIAGEGKLEKEYRAKVDAAGLRENVQFLGRVEHEDMGGLYRRADIFVLPSLNEGMPVAALEALASGLPIVSTDLPAMRNLVEDGKNGFLVPKLDARALADAMGRYIDGGQAMLDAHGSASREKAFKFTWERAAAGYEEYYNKAVLEQ